MAISKKFVPAVNFEKIHIARYINADAHVDVTIGSRSIPVRLELKLLYNGTNMVYVQCLLMEYSCCRYNKTLSSI